MKQAHKILLSVPDNCLIPNCCFALPTVHLVYPPVLSELETPDTRSRGLYGHYPHRPRYPGATRAG
jgi:hypothetical protein